MITFAFEGHFEAVETGVCAGPAIQESMFRRPARGKQIM
jgi:hypothetical protein